MTILNKMSRIENFPKIQIQIQTNTDTVFITIFAYSVTGFPGKSRI